MIKTSLIGVLCIRRLLPMKSLGAARKNQSSILALTELTRLEQAYIRGSPPSGAAQELVDCAYKSNTPHAITADPTNERAMPLSSYDYKKFGVRICSLIE